VTRAIHVGLSISPSEDFRAAALPLFERELVDALEWNVDMGWSAGGLLDWVRALVDAYGAAGRLYAHGVELSLMSARLTPRHERWLADLATEVRSRRYVHLTEHFGFMTAGSFTGGTPMPLPRSDALVALVRERLGRLHDVAQVPVGLENLAFALGPRDVEEQPELLEQFLAPVDGFLLLDAHNLWCQAVNFGADPLALLARYPLERVRELHVAGGAWSHPRSDPQKRAFRRDTHEDLVPEDVFPIVEQAVRRCPALEVIILERTDHSLESDAAIARWQGDFMRLREIVAMAGPAEAPPPTRVPEVSVAAASDADVSALDAYQAALLETLYDSEDAAAAVDALSERREMKPFASYVATFEPRAVETGMELLWRWGERTRSRPKGKMRVARLEHARGPWQHTLAALPKPGPGQVRVRVHACGVCGTDLHLWRGDFPVALPIVAGHEPAGVVDALGEGVTTLAEGDRVGVSWTQGGCGRCAECARGRALYCERPVTWIQNGGGFADYVLAEATGCTRLPDGVSFVDAAPMFCAGFTVMSGYRRAQPRPGDRVAVIGLGGLGHLALQIAKAHGHEVVAITSSAGKQRELVALGADVVLVTKEHVGRELAATGGADVILGTSNDLARTSEAVHGLRPEGRLVAMALGEGALAIDPMTLLAKQASVVGAMQSERRDLVDLLELVARGRVRPVVEHYPLAQLGRVVQRLGEGRVRYRAVLHVADS